MITNEGLKHSAMLLVNEDDKDENMHEYERILLTMLEPLWIGQGQLIVR